MKVLFIGQDVWNIIRNLVDEESYNNLTQDEKDSLREWGKKDAKSMFFIHQAMHESTLPRVAATITTKKAWDTLGTSYQGLDKVNNSKLHILRRDFESLSMK